MKKNLALMLIILSLCISADAQKLIQHLDASIPSSIILDDSSHVSQWFDQSGYGNHALPDTGNIGNISVDGDWLVFGGEMAYLELFNSAESDAWLDQSTADSGFCVLLALKVNSLNNNFTFLGNATTLGGTFRFLITSAGKIKISLGGVSKTFNNNLVKEGDDIVLALNYTYVDSVFEVWCSKESSSSIVADLAPADFSSENSFKVGNIEGLGSAFEGAIGEVKIYNKALSQADFVAERDSLSKKWTGAEGGSGSGTGSGEILIRWRVIDENPDFPSEDIIVAAVSVTDSGFNNPLPSDPANSDCSATFQEALDLVRADGGGTVFVPEGHYRLDNSLKIPANVALRGHWREIKADKPAIGTIIKVYAEKNNPDGASLISVGENASIRDITFWHPEQDPVNIIGYPYVIEGGGSPTTIENITLVNAYKGVYLRAASSCFVDNIDGTALKIGIKGLSAAAIARIDKININPYTWKWANLDATSPDPAYKDYMLSNCIGADLREMEAFRLTNSRYEGLKYGVYFDVDPSTGGDSNGSLASVTTIGCKVGLMYVSALSCGLANCHIEGIDAAVKGIGGIVAINSYFKGGNSSLESTEKKFELSHCIIDGKIQVEAEIKALACEFQNTGTDIVMNSSVATGWILGCTFADGPDIINNAPSSADIIIDHEAGKGFAPAPEANTKDMSIRRKPYVTKMYNIMDFGAIPNDGIDDTDALAEAVDSVNAYGGIVFIPNGRFDVSGSFTLNSGTELRGAHGGRFMTAKDGHLGTVLYITGNENNSNGPAFITLKENCGVRGMSIFYPKQEDYYSNGLDESITPYPYTFRVVGNNVYVADLFLINSYQGVHFQNSNNHLLENSFIGGLHNIVYAENCVNGMIDNNLVKPGFFGKYRTDINSGNNSNMIKMYAAKYLTSFEIKNCTNYTLSNMFNHCSHQFVKVINSSGIGKMLGGEQLQRAYHFEGSKDFYLVSSGANTNHSGDETGNVGLSTSSDFTGTVHLYSGGFKGTKAFDIDGGTVNSVFGGAHTKSIFGFSLMDVAPGAELNLSVFDMGGFVALNRDTGSAMNLEAVKFHYGVPVNYLSDDEIVKNYASYNKAYAFACFTSGDISQAGMKTDMTNIHFEKLPIFSYDQFDGRNVKGGVTSNGEYTFEVTDSVYKSGTVSSMNVEIRLLIETKCLLNFYHNGPNGPVLDKTVNFDNTGDNPNSSKDSYEKINYTISNYEFGTSSDIRIEVSSGDAPIVAYIILIRSEAKDFVVEDFKANFFADTTNISIGDEVTFTDYSVGQPTSWDWTFVGGTPETSTEQNPTVTYDSAGTYQVTLLVSNSSGNDTETKADYITVTDTISNNFITKNSSHVVSVYPCPAKDEIYVSIIDDRISEFTFNLYNLNGTLILTEQIYTDSKIVFKLDISLLTSGIYTYQLTSNIKTTNGKIIIQ